MDIERLKRGMAMGSKTGRVMSEIVLSVFNGNTYKVGLSDFTNLDRNNFPAALEIIGYRKEANWNERTLSELAEIAKERLSRES